VESWRTGLCAWGADIVARVNAEVLNAIKRSQVVVWGAIAKGTSAPPDTAEIVAHRVFKGEGMVPPRKVAEGVVLDLGVDAGFGPVSKAPPGTTRTIN